MPLKKPNHVKIKDEVDCDRVCCPVCSLYLRKEITLHDHLNTHPKQQVIEALIQLKNACKDLSRPNSAQARGSTCSGNNVEPSAEETEIVVTPIISVGDSEEEESDIEVASPTKTRPFPQQPVLPGLPSTSDGHFLQIPQFMSHTSVPQFIHVPVVPSVYRKPIPLSHTQAPVIYSPFLCPPGPSSASGPAHLNPSRHMPYFSPNNLLRTPFSIFQARSKAVVPQISLFPVPPLDLVKTTVEPLCPAIVPESPSTICEDSHGTSSSSEEETEPVGETWLSPVKERPQSPTSSHHSEEVGVEQGAQFETILPHSEPGSPATEELDHPECKTRSPQDRVAWHDQALLSPPKKRRCSDWSSLGSPGGHSTCSTEGGLRVRSDLSASASESPSRPVGEELRQNVAKSTPTKGTKRSLSFSENSDHLQSNDEDRHPFVHASLSTTSRVEYVGSPPANTNAHHHGSNCSDGEETEENHGVEEEVVLPDVYFPIRACSPPCDSGPPSPYQKSVESCDSPATPLNIQTDETMPPRGELSEQESIGGNSSSMWSVPAFHTSRELPSPVVSYDLTARESWPGSDMSDTEGNANLVPENPQSQRFTTTPTFSNQLHPFMSVNLPRNSYDDGSPFSSCRQTQGEPSDGNFDDKNQSAKTAPNKAGKSKSSAAGTVRKAPAKPRVFRCKECSSEFSSLKLRRLHPCEQLSNSNGNSSAPSATPIDPLVNKNSEDNSSVPGSSSRDGESSSQSKPKRKYTRKPKAPVKKEILSEDQLSGQANFTNQFLINKSDPDKVSLSIKSQLSSESSSSLSLPRANTDMDFVEVTLKPDLSQPSLERYQCVLCDENFPTSKRLNQHIIGKHKGEKYTCAVCGETFFEKERAYLEHLNVHPLECQMCGKTFKRRKSLALHMKWHLEVKPHKCETCSKSFVTRQKLDEHQNTHTGNAPIKCSVCDETFKRYSNLIQHRNRHHLKVKKKTKDYICHCGEVYQSKKKLDWHKEIHEDKPKSCHYCSEKFVHTVSLTRHVRRAHDRRYVPKKERETENIECPVCHLIFMKSSLAAHLKTHGGERPYSCNICGKYFTTKWNLHLHRWTHASRSSKPFKCTLCKAAFYRKQDYTIHMYSHRNVRPFTCNHCGCQFFRKYNCIRHMREHEEGKNFTCTICNKTFHRSYYLKDHMRVHSGVRPFSCHICGKASSSKTNHNKHVRIHHARETQNTEV